MTYDVIVIGAGAAGMAAALEAQKEHASVLLIERDHIMGGILNQCIHNGFGLTVFKEELTGPEYADRFIKALEDTHIRIMVDTTVIDIKKTGDVFDLTVSGTTVGYIHLFGKSVVLSAGCYERTRGAIRIPGERPKGIMPAGSAQRYLNMDGYLVGERIFILGSGDIGLIMARRMTLEGAKVLGVAELMPYSNGLTRNIVQCLDDFDIPLHLSHTVTAIEGKDVLKRITISAVDNHYRPIPGTEKHFDVDTLLLSVGLIPDIQLFDHLNLDLSIMTGSAIVNQHLETSVPGLFACGNALHVHDLVDFVSLEGAKAGRSAAYYAKKPVKRQSSLMDVHPGTMIHHIVPQRIDLSDMVEPVELSFRTTTKAKVAKFVLRQDGVVIKEQKATFVAPAEMEKITICANLLKSDQALTLDMEVLKP
ncbi:MAG: FAD-dependent oxidoreductase [Acholeplasmataceae bacterium]|nr:FAD-dependent oxidoreductase [Acholeplasmataceae bacterium]